MENQNGNLRCLGEVKLPAVPTGVKGLNGRAQLGNQFKILGSLTFLVSGLRISHAESALMIRQYRG